MTEVAHYQNEVAVILDPRTEVQHRATASPDTIQNPHHGDGSIKELNRALAQHGLSDEDRQRLRFARAMVYYEQGRFNEAKRDLLVASRLHVDKNRVDVLVLLAKVLAKEGHTADVVTLLTEAWQLPGTFKNGMLTEQIVLVLGQLPIAAGGLPLLALVIEIGVRIDNYTDDCRIGLLKLAHDLLQVDVPSIQVPHLATIISRMYRETDQHVYETLRANIITTITKLAHVDHPAPIEQAVAIATLMPLLAGRLNGTDDQLFRVENAGVWGALSQGAFFSALQDFDVRQRARLVRFTKWALTASADRQYRLSNGDTSDPHVVPHSQLISTWSVLRRIAEAIDDDGSLKKLREREPRQNDYTPLLKRENYR